MRFYTKEEAIKLAEYFNTVYKRDNLLLTSPLTAEDILSQKTMKFCDFLENYKLNYGDDTYEPYLEMLGSKEYGVNDEIAEYNIDNPDDLRYPLIVLGYNTEDVDKVPDMSHFLELTYTLENFSSNTLEVIVIDKMLKPFDKDLLDRYADNYGISDYNYHLYS